MGRPSRRVSMRLSTDTKKVSRSMCRMEREARPELSVLWGRAEKGVAEDFMKRAQVAC